MKTNTIYNKSCIEMEEVDSNSIDLTVTSPPYDNLRTYGGYDFDFEPIAQELYRVTKDGGVVVWVVGDATIKGSETGTSFKQALYFKEMGFNLHDTMIWNKDMFTAVGSLKTRYGSVFEYMFVFSKGSIKTFNPIKDRPNVYAGKTVFGKMRQSDSSFKNFSKKIKIEDFGQRFNIWTVYPERANSKSCHPAPFPEQLAQDHILSWSNENDIILDPMFGSGTTLKMAKKLNRKYIGFETNKRYCKIAKQRLEAEKTLWDQKESQ